MSTKFHVLFFSEEYKVSNAYYSLKGSNKIEEKNDVTEMGRPITDLSVCGAWYMPRGLLYTAR
jgi:hypothetical protein